MAETNFDITGLNGKVANGGVNSKGRLTAEEFNLLVNAAIESQSKIDQINHYFSPISESEFDEMVREGTLEDRPYFIYED